jgi:2-polyprenyl-3-methyl-5-hydroxy-6-metoxy-1,4-benzoquinol methylase
MIRCDLCYSEKYCVVEPGEHKYKVLKCSRCGLVYVYPKPPKRELKRHYNSDYYHEWMDRQKQRRVHMWQKRLKAISRETAIGRLLDIGCGEGLFLKIAQENGWSVEGTEISEFACKSAAQNIGKEIWTGEVWDACFYTASFDVVTIWHVLEHGVDPLKTLKEARRVLKSDGLCVVAVPNLNDWCMQLAYWLLKRKRLSLFSPDDKELHLYHFSVHTLENILIRAGFDKIKIRPDFGIIEPGKKLVNFLATIPFYLMNLHLYNSLEAIACPKS